MRDYRQTLKSPPVSALIKAARVPERPHAPTADGDCGDFHGVSSTAVASPTDQRGRQMTGG